MSSSETLNTLRPRRSVLYMPGANTRAMDKARSLDADTVILDLEDAVAPAQKAQAREYIAAALQEGGYGARELVVRVNGFDSPYLQDDIDSLKGLRFDGLCLPKAESAAQVQALENMMDAAGIPSSVGLWLMIETPNGVLAAAEIAAASSRVVALVMGTSDLAKDLRVPHTASRLGFLSSLGLVVLAARAAGVDVLDGVHLDLSDEAGFAAVCEQGRELGFDGKTLIHPKQLADANRVFSPSELEVERAGRICAAWAEAEAQGLGVCLLDGKLVESLHVEEAERCLAIAEAIAARQ